MEDQIEEQKRVNQTPLDNNHHNNNKATANSTCKERSPKKAARSRKRSAVEPEKHRNIVELNACASVSHSSETIDDTSHATGTVHWGVPKEHCPKYTNNHNKIVKSYSGANSTITKQMMTHSPKAANHSDKFATLQDYYHHHSTNVSLPQNHKPHQQIKSKSSKKKLSRSSSCSSSSSASQDFHSSASGVNTNNYYPSLAANYFTSQSKDMTAYFEYVSQCLKDGQIPNVYGFYNSLAVSRSSLLSPEVTHSASKSPQKRYSDTSQLDNTGGAIDLSVKKSKNNHDFDCHDHYSGFKVDQNGALDLSVRNK